MATQGSIQLNVVINEKSISIERKNIVNFSVDRVLGDAADKFTLELFDESAWKVESALKGKSMAPITVQYSASTDLSSKTILFSGIVLDYQVAFSGRSSMITLEGILAYVGEGTASYLFTKANIEWVGGQNSEGTAIDGKNMSWISSNMDNEDICAILVEQNGNQVPYYNPGRIFKRIIHKYNGDNLGTNGQEQSAGYSASSSDLKENIWNFFRNNGFSEAATAGIMGNIQAESGFIVDRKQSGGPAAGLFQWENYNTKEGRWLALNNYATARGKSWTDVGMQLEYALSEMSAAFSTYSGKGGNGTYKNGQAWGWNQKISLDTFKNQTDVGTATEMFERCFERASIPHMSTRKQYAQGYYNLYTGKTTTGTTISQTLNGEWGTGGDGSFILGNVDETMWVQNVPLQQTNETTSQYIGKLAKYAVATPNNMSAAEVGLLLINNEINTIDTSNLSAGFKYTMNGSRHSFTQMDYTGTGAAKQKIVYGSRDSNVISFAVSNVGQMVMTNSNVDDETGQALFDTSSLDYLYAEEISQAAMGNTNSDETIYQNWWGLNAKKYRVEVKSSSTPSSLLTDVKYAWRRNTKLDNLS